MKYIFLSIAFLSSIFIFGQNQHNIIKAGINFANISSESRSFTTRISFHAGFGIENEFSEQFSLAPEVLFSSQGAKAKNGSSREFRLNYINLPIMFRFYPSKGFFLEAGPQGGILVSARQSSDGNYDSNVENIKGQDYGFNLGLGFKSESVIGINARYYFGLRDINDYEYGEKLKNGVLQISLSFYIN
ncbi:PorT family protein [Subsaxibacter sp. CAU 1640]|uniref:porin family protein n=1 Tax=Subsaxibacter sp. CAU 1640 TaxID=2933271 RepID=UPI0020048383|nr:porin family protein [Subsaxibacter sp. CAU 1640]MCK7591196.1 PorT family protein [Subsaxibacter sp. CAU 1640]